MLTVQLPSIVVFDWEENNRTLKNDEKYNVESKIAWVQLWEEKWSAW